MFCTSSPAPRGVQRLQLLLGGALPGGDLPEEDRLGLLRHRVSGQVARRRGRQDPQGHGAHPRAAAGLQERDAGPKVSAEREREREGDPSIPHLAHSPFLSLFIFGVTIGRDSLVVLDTEQGGSRWHCPMSTCRRPLARVP